MKKLSTLFVSCIMLMFSGLSQPTHVKFPEKFDSEKYSEYFNENIFFGNENPYLLIKPASQIKGSDWYEPDTITFYLISPYEVDYRYLLSYEDGKLTTQMHQFWNFDHWEDYEKYVYYYDEYNNCKEMISQRMFSEQWVNHFKCSLSYDVSNNIISHIHQYWVSEQWLDFRLYSCTYDSQNNKTSMLFQYWEEDTWFISQKESYTYDEQNNLIEMQRFVDFTEYQSYDKVIYKYDNNDNLIDEIWYWWDDEQWVIGIKYVNTYDTQNRKTSYSCQGYNSDEDWFDFWKYTYFYDKHNNMIEALFQKRESEQLIDDRKDIYNYDSQNNMISHIKQYWDKEKWINMERFTYTFDDNHNTTESYYQWWGKDEWVDVDASGAGHYHVYYNNNQSSICWNSAHKIVVSYININEEVPEEKPTEKGSEKLYPNPVSNILYIETDTDKTMPIVKIYSMHGVLLLSTKGKQIDLSSLPNGIYIAEIEGVCKKIVKQ